MMPLARTTPLARARVALRPPTRAGRERDTTFAAGVLLVILPREVLGATLQKGDTPNAS